MAIPLSITDLSATAANNSPAGTEPMGTQADDYLRSHAAIIRTMYDSILSGNLINLVPAGAMIEYAAPVAPPGWLTCDGSQVSRVTYAVLFAIVGTTYGAGDGSTTFNLPDRRGVFVRGFDNGRGLDANRAFGSLQGDQMPSHTHIGSASAAPNHVHNNVLNDPGHVHPANVTDPGHSHPYGGSAFNFTGSGGGIAAGTATGLTTGTSATGITVSLGTVATGLTITNGSAGAFTPVITVAAAGAGAESRPVNVCGYWIVKT